jgi:hypothetical protein
MSKKKSGPPMHDPRVEEILETYTEPEHRPEPHAALSGERWKNGPPLLEPELIMKLVRYCADEVRRQGDGPVNVADMFDAWMQARLDWYSGREMTVFMIETWGKLVEPNANSVGFRRQPIGLGGPRGWRQIGCQAWEIEDRLNQLINMIRAKMTPNDAYQYFEESIHPFLDGNGRTGKILFNFLSGTLDEPIMPRNNWNVSNP